MPNQCQITVLEVAQASNEHSAGALERKKHLADGLFQKKIGLQVLEVLQDGCSVQIP